MKVLALVLSLVFVSACGTSNADKDDSPPQVSVLAADRFCGQHAGLSLITSADQSAQQPMVVSQTLAKSQLDWSNYQILRINMGQQPNMGYSLAYPGGARLIEGRLQIPIQWNRPQAGRMYAQMLVEPCLLLSIPRRGYDSIEVVDQNGRLRWSLTDLSQ